MKNKKIHILDDEDLISDNKVKDINKNKLIKNDNDSKDIYSDDNFFCEFILMDFRNLDDLNTYTNIKSLTLINQGITSIEMIAYCKFSLQIEYLCLNENLLPNLKFIDNFKNLTNLQVNFNQIGKIDDLINLQKLETLWICENKIKKLENLPSSIKTLWIAANQIEIIDETLIDSNIIDLNISANFLYEFSNISQLKKFKKLKNLCLNDINFGDNPICSINNYRILLLHKLPKLDTLDNTKITEEELKEVENIFAKKYLFYKNKIQNHNKSTRSVIKLLKCYKTFYTGMRNLQIFFFSSRIKMLEHIGIEECLTTNEENNSFDVKREVDTSKNKLKKCLNDIEILNQNFKELKVFISHINDFMIVNNFYELESGGNIRIEPGTCREKWVTSCIELIKSRISDKVSSLKSLNFIKMWKIMNKEKKIIFEKIYNDLLDINNLVTDDKKHYDFLFINISNVTNEIDVLELLFDKFHQKSDNIKYSDVMSNLLLSNHPFKIDEMKESQFEDKNKFMIICKCIMFDNTIYKCSDNYSTLNLDKILKQIENENSIDRKFIIEFTPLDDKLRSFIYLNDRMYMPEYIVEYNYNFNNFLLNSIDINEKNEISSYSYRNTILSSYTNKNEISEENINLLNMCNELLFYNEPNKINLANSWLNPFNENVYKKYLKCRFREFEELDNTSIFFAKNSILKFMKKYFKYNNFDEFREEFNKIKDKLFEIENLNFKFNNLEKLAFSFNLKNLKIISLYNSKLNNLDDLKPLMCLEKLEEFILSLNYLSHVNFNLLNSKLSKLDLSHNRISLIDNLFSLINLSSLDISFNLISDNTIIKQILLIRLKEFNYIRNPLRTELNCLVESNYEVSLSNIEFNIKKNFMMKPFNIIYNTFSFTNKYEETSIHFSDEENESKSAIILIKQKFRKIPNLVDKYPSNEFKILYLSLNKIKKIENLEHFEYLEELYLQYNRISRIENLKIKSLIKLDLSNNLLYDIEGISHICNLKCLNLENNFISNLCIEELTSLTNLSELYFSGNNLNNLNECLELRKLNNLRILDLNDNLVCKNNKDFRFYMIFTLSHLIILNKIQIEQNEIKNARDYFEGKITSDLLISKFNSNDISNLINLNLSNCKLKDTTNENFFNYTTNSKLEKLDLSRNLLASFKIFGFIPSLKELNLNSNLYEVIINKKEKQINQKGILGLINLEILEMSNNTLYDLNGVQKLESLKILILRQNNLNKIHCIDNLLNLSYLDVSFNKLRNIEKSNLGHLPSLGTLICESNMLKNVNAFSKFQNLQYLSFDSNKLTDFLSIEKLSILKNLKEINFKNNNLSKLYNYRIEILKLLPDIIKIDNNEVSIDEREMAFLELKLTEDNRDNYFSNVNQIYDKSLIYKSNSSTKQATKINKLQDCFNSGMKVNFINLDLLGTQNPQKLISESEVNKRISSPKNEINLPNIILENKKIRKSEIPVMNDQHWINKINIQIINCTNNNQLKINKRIRNDSKLKSNLNVLNNSKNLLKNTVESISTPCDEVSLHKNNQDHEKSLIFRYFNKKK